MLGSHYTMQEFAGGPQQNPKFKSSWRSGNYLPLAVAEHLMDLCNHIALLTMNWMNLSKNLKRSETYGPMNYYLGNVPDYIVGPLKFKKKNPR